MLRKKGFLRDEEDSQVESKDASCALEACRKTCIARGTFERVNDRGERQMNLFPDDVMSAPRTTKAGLVANVDNFSVEAGVCFGALDRAGRERILKYCFRPAIALEL